MTTLRSRVFCFGAALAVSTGLLASKFCQAQASAGPFATRAVVEADYGGKKLPLQRDEQIALMFAVAITNLEFQCHMNVTHFCSMDELVAGVKGVGALKFDPRTTDPNYIYVLNAGANTWEMKVTPKKPGLGGFYLLDANGSWTKKFYNPKGEASITSWELEGDGVTGDAFNK